MNRTTKVGLLVVTLCLATAGRASANAVRSAPPVCLNPTGAPGPFQASVYLQTGFGPTCYTLDMGSTDDPWTAWDESYGFPNDAVRSVKTGSGVTLVLFWNNFNTQDNGATFSFPPNSAVSSLGSWNGRASAARVQTFAANSSCAISVPNNNYMALFTDANFSGDCNAIVIGFGQCYADPFAMGFRNDTMSSVYNASAVYEAAPFADANFHNYLGGISPQSSLNFAPIINDRISSMGGELNPPCQ